MGPYYLTALIALLGPVRRVSGSAGITFPERTIGSKAWFVATIAVTTPTHVAGLLEFAGGPIGTLVTSFDIPVEMSASDLPRIEIYRTEGNVRIHDPNEFGGPVCLRLAGWRAWREVRSDSPYTANMRGLGSIDLARAIRQGGAFRANGKMAFHVLDAMQSILESAQGCRRIELTSDCERPEPMSLTLEIPDPDQTLAEQAR